MCGFFKTLVFLEPIHAQCLGSSSVVTHVCTSPGRSGSRWRVTVVKQGNKWSFMASAISVNRHLSGPSSDIYIPAGWRMRVTILQSVIKWKGWGVGGRLINIVNKSS